MLLKLIKKIRGKIFNRILFFNSIIIISVMMMLLSVLTLFYLDSIIKKEQTENLLMLNDVKVFFDDKNSSADKAIRELQSDEDLLSDAIYAMNNTYTMYYENRLDNYSESSNFIPENVETFFQSFYFADSDICGVSLINISNGTSFDIIINNNLWNENVEEISVYKEDFLNNASEEEPSKNEKTEEQVVNDIYFINKPLINPVTLQKVGNVCFYFSLDYLKAQIKEEYSDFKGSIYVLNSDGEEIHSTNSEMVNMDSVEASKVFDQVVKYDGERFIVSTIEDSKTDYSYISASPLKSLSQLPYFLLLILLITVVLIGIAILVTSFVMRSYSRRINQINQAMVRLQLGDFEVQVPVSNEDDELELISSTFNQMRGELKGYIDKVYVSSIKQREAELRVLQTQVNPHFLYNSLEVIRMKAITEDAKVTSEMIVYLGKIFRYSLETRENVFLQEEIVFISQHLKMFQFRFPNQLDVELDIAEECKEVYLQRFTLQPIVENYFMHGFKMESDENRLYISARKVSGDIKICINDNGNGIPASRLKEIEARLQCETIEDSIGLHNVHQRIQMMHGMEYGLKIESVEKSGTFVTIKFPFESTS